ncbi:LysR substrate-binding domain-containing protein [Brevundimonas sp. SL130]|uniref:LysR substrate-binding domain-containing protein n=1 Tax=Brevundimonas sp. SL130 TaxID=2995143 RepID=UPI00226D18A9|nr:LysR substrate-binding domain-containing protein [Brevundimonas sp. SL130]WAC61149.1 LysR substrate-binding domain-containing protein [Brevundimonas sp. SL130]
MRSAAPPPLNALRTFEAFARHGSMTRAAAELCVTHGAVSRQIAALQASLGVVLVAGPRHALVLTEAGVQLAERLTPAFGAIADAVQATRHGAAREIEISCLGTFALKWLIPRLPDFLAAHPEVRVRLSESYSPVDYRRDRFDGAIRIIEPDEVYPRAQATRFLSQHQGPVGAPALMSGLPTLAAVAAAPRLRSATFRRAWPTWAALAGLDLPPAKVEREFAHNHSMVEAAVSGMGVAIAPWAFVAPDVTAGRLAAPFGFVERPSWFAFLRPEGRQDPAVDAFRDWLVAQGEVSPPPPSGAAETPASAPNF